MLKMFNYVKNDWVQFPQTLAIAESQADCPLAIRVNNV